MSPAHLLQLPVYLGIDKDTYYPKIASLAELHEDCRYDIHDIEEYEQCYCTNGNPENFELKLEDSSSIQRLVDKYCLTDEELSDPWTGLRIHLVMTRRIMVAPAFEDYIPPKEMSCNLELDLPKVSTKLYFAGLGRNGHLHVPTAIWQFERLGIEFIDIETLEDKGKENN